MGESSKSQPFGSLSGEASPSKPPTVNSSKAECGRPAPQGLFRANASKLPSKPDGEPTMFEKLSATSTVAPRSSPPNLFGNTAPPSACGGLSTLSTGGAVFGTPSPMDARVKAGSGGSNMTVGRESFGSNTFGSLRASGTQEGLFARPVSQQVGSDKCVAASQAIDLGSTILTIIAGEGERQRTFTVHENLIASRSNYIKNFIKEHPETKTIDLKRADPTPFILYTQLLYFNHIPCKHPVNDNAHCHEEYCLLAKLYVLGVELQDRETKNAAIDAIFAKAQGGPDLLPSSEHVWILYNGTTGPCAARKMLVDFYAAKATQATMQGQSFPVEFMNDLAMSFVAGRSVAFRGLVVHGGVGIYHEK